jgi:hypothetical protein
LQAEKAQGVKLGGLNAKGIANREQAQRRAEALRPIFGALAGMSHRKMAAELNAMGEGRDSDRVNSLIAPRNWPRWQSTGLSIRYHPNNARSVDAG